MGDLICFRNMILGVLEIHILWRLWSFGVPFLNFFELYKHAFEPNLQFQARMESVSGPTYVPRVPSALTGDRRL